MAQTHFLATKDIAAAINGNAANVWTLVNSDIEVDSTGITCSIKQSAAGFDSSKFGVAIAGDNEEVVQIKPNYQPFMKRGELFAGMVANLKACETELTDYQFIKLTSGYLVWGIASTTQTDFYTPQLANANDVINWEY